ncbi:hypothetical protein CWI36_1775p0010, partial [Hamiltosporidium magnivora]
MGRKKNFRNEKSKNTKIKAVNDADELDTLPSAKPPLPSSVEVSACEPSYEMTNPCARAIPELHMYYNEKFGCTETLEVLKKLAQSEMGKELKSEENGERRRIAICLGDTCTLTDTTEYINLRDKFLSKIKEISMNE